MILIEPSLPYDFSSRESIVRFAKQLIGKTLREACGEKLFRKQFKGKGGFGQLLEKYYFQYEPNSESEPDFAKANLELKSSPLKRLSTGGYKSKERLVLSIINYLEIPKQVFETSDLWRKNSALLLVFYLHENQLDIVDFLIKIVGQWSFPEEDLIVIKKDWDLIKQKIVAGKAHELSEGDTLYLGACTKGANANTKREQPFSKIPAKQRAYSLKQGYVNHIIASLANDPAEVYGKLISPSVLERKRTFDEIVIERFERFYGKSPSEILASLEININPKAKSFYADLTKAILNVELNKSIEEFEKAEIVVKTVRLQENNLPKEDISFKAFKFCDIVNESWEESDFKNILEKKFLFIFFQFEKGKLFLRKVRFWNMPHQDLLSAKKVWTKTKQIINEGRIVASVKNDIRFTNFPSKQFNPISHVRPHARNADDTYPLPFPDRLTKVKAYTKQCFWLNNTYIRDEVYLKA